MDILSRQLQDFLIHLGKEPTCVSEKVEHYIKHILHLLSVQDEEIFKQYYGLFGTKIHPLDNIACKHGVSADAMMQNIEANLRKLAITPEWQIVKQLLDIL